MIQDPVSCWIQDPGSRTLDPGPWIQDPGTCIQDPGSRTLDLGSCIQDPRSRILDPGSWIQDPGARILDPGSRILDPDGDLGGGVRVRLYFEDTCFAYIVIRHRNHRMYVCVFYLCVFVLELVGGGEIYTGLPLQIVPGKILNRNFTAGLLIHN